MRRCGDCGYFEPAGAPACARCAALVDEIVETGWRAFVERDFPGFDERELAEMVAEEPDRHEWRVVDAAYDRLTCRECGERLSRGPVGCTACDLANGFRFSAIEVDRPGVPPGNEHALRVNVAVVRRPHWESPAELIARRLALPILLEGHLPTTRQAQAARALLRDGGTEEDYAAYIYREWVNR
ncbi:hypothetical protein [Thermoactinospora rubra]|uniref:hypothetical protein n=1 Tax=Thermoactinospora rubra TaxID=1088767 RepID=UPI001F0ADD4D|nr:hypothetical protein [Thermoactinospora rubra]